MAHRTPVFSRRQLNLIIIITAVVIALLSIPSEPWPQILRTSIQQTSLSYINDQPSELRLSFALSQPTLQPSAPAQLLQQLLQQRLRETEGVVTTSLHSDRISVSVTATSSSALIQRLQQIPALLNQPFAPEAITKAIKQQRAQQHLDRNQQSALQKVDAWLHQQPQESGTDTITPETISQLQQLLFSRAQLSLSLTDPDPEQVIAALHTVLAQFNPGQAWPGQDESSTTPAPVNHELQPVTALQPLAGRTSTAFPLTLLLSRILADLSPEATIRLYPGNQVSWLIWLSPSTNQPSTDELANLIKRIQQRLAAMQDWELERAADDLRDQLQQRMSQPEPLANQLEVIAFYQLPVDYLPQFEATIAALTRTEIRQQLLDLLQPERFSYPVFQP